MKKSTCKQMTRLSKLLLIGTFCFLSIVGRGQHADETYSFDFKNKSYVEVFKEIEQKTNYRFFYSNADLQGLKNLTLSASNLSLKALMERVLEGTELSFEVKNDHTIVLKKVPPTTPITTNPKMVVQGTGPIELKGVVTDAVTNEPMPFTSVIAQQSKVNVVTNDNGEFTITVPANEIYLIVSFIGYANETVPIGTQRNFQITLKPEAKELEEVVVVGYGSARKPGTQIGQITQVSAAKLQDRPSANVMDALQGKVAGLQVFTSSGEPSATSSVRLHGKGSLTAGSAPLYILDGIPVEASTIMGLNPNDFESITVLTDASATSIYGSRGANGVIYYTTKRGSLNQDAVISASAMYGVSSLASTKFYDRLMDTYELAQYYVASGYKSQIEVNKLLTDYPYDTKWGDWFFTKGAPTYQADLSIRGGGGKTTYFISGGVFNQQGLAPHSGYDRYSVRSNIDSRVNNWLRVGMNLSGFYNYTETTRGMNGPVVNGGLIYAAVPYYTPYDKNGNDLDYIDGLEFYNPKYVAETRESHSSNAAAVGSTYIEIRPLENLILKTVGGLDASDSRSTFKNFPSSGYTNGYGQAEESFGRIVRSSITNTAEYKFDIKIKHSFVLLAGHEYTNSSSSGFLASSYGQTSDHNMNLQDGILDNSSSSSLAEYAYLSFFGRVDYNYDNKYYADFSIRNDQSSRFPPQSRSATFYSGGLKWDIKSEDFLKSAKWLSRLTIGGSVGSQGNSAIGDYTYWQMVSSSTPYKENLAWMFASPGNENLTWETQILASVELNAEFWQKLRAKIGFYNRQTKNMLMRVPYPYTSGFGSVMMNVGGLRNRGVDVKIDWDIYRSKDWLVNFNAIFNYNADRLTSLFNGEDTYLADGVVYVVGESPKFFFPIYAGINPQNGKQQWYLAGENKTKTLKGGTSEIFANSTMDQNTGLAINAPVNGGFGFFASWKGLSLSADFSYVLGKYMLNNDKYFTDNPAMFLGQINQSQDVMDFWTNDKKGQTTKFPAIGEVIQFDTHLIENASFLRLKLLTINYDFPAAWLQRTRAIKAAKVFVSSRNLLTLTKFEGVDPEVDNPVSMGSYPNSRQFSVGLGITF